MGRGLCVLTMAWQSRTMSHFLPVIAFLLSGMVVSSGADTSSNNPAQHTHTTITASEMNDCLAKQTTLRPSERNVQIIVDNSDANHSESSLNNTYQTCFVNLTAPQNMVYKIHTDMFYTAMSCSLYDTDREFVVTEGDYTTIIACNCPDRIVTLSPRVSVRVRTCERRKLRIRMTLTAVPAQHSLVKNFTSDTQGFVQSPGLMDGFPYPRDQDLWSHLKVPPDHVAMLSFLFLRLQRKAVLSTDAVTLYIGGMSPADLQWSRRGAEQPLPAVYETNDIHIRFQTGLKIDFEDVKSNTGFKLLVTYHSTSQKPEKSSDGLMWNCSVDYWPEFEPHLKCNLLLECQNGEDESSCPYTTPTCGKNKFSAGGSCFYLPQVQPENSSMSWNQARKECASRGHLASLHTPSKWDEVFAVAETGRPARLFFGLHFDLMTVPSMYRSLRRWADGSTAFFVKDMQLNIDGDCTVYRKNSIFQLDYAFCNQRFTSVSYLCESPQRPSTDSVIPVNLSSVQEVAKQAMRRSFDWLCECPQGHFTQPYLEYEPHCKGARTGSNRSRDLISQHPVYYACSMVGHCVPYTLVCDHREDCPDGSDEDFCLFPLCQGLGISTFECSNAQCIPIEQRCDKVDQCFDHSDETGCSAESEFVFHRRPPGMVDMNGKGRLAVTDLNLSLSLNDIIKLCPSTHFQCHIERYYCLPVYLRCNRIVDCPGGEDEAGCATSTCPGMYRCRSSTVCLLPQHMCDGKFQCPKHDDEHLCNLINCPKDCQCFGLEFICTKPFEAHLYEGLRFLKADSSGMNFDHLTKNIFLVYLDLAMNPLTKFDVPRLPNLQYLDVSFSRITCLNVSQLFQIPNLLSLNLSFSPITSVFTLDHTSTRVIFPKLQILDLSHAILRHLDDSWFDRLGATSITTLNLSYSGLTTIQGKGFQSLKHLQILHMEGCPLRTYSRDIFRGLHKLQNVYADNYKICCPEILPPHFETSGTCFAPVDEISSCKSLLREDYYRLFLYIFAALALISNVGSLIYRVCLRRKDRKGSVGDCSCDVFVSYLCVSDSFMGVYLVIIGAADQVYKGSYVWKDQEWKDSLTCTVAGFLSLLSSEVSALLIFLITIDRLLILRLPLGRFVFTNRSAHCVSVVTWLFGLAMAGLPILKGWNFYNQTGICIPLPITRMVFQNHYYSFGIIIVFNLGIFIMVALGQTLIYRSLQACLQMQSETPGIAKNVDLRITRRLIAIAMTDFLCWFPISVLGICASLGLPVPGHANIAVTIFALPINATLNPFIYTLSLLVEKKRAQQLSEEDEQEEAYSMTNAAPTESTVAVVGVGEGMAG